VLLGERAHHRENGGADARKQVVLGLHSPTTPKNIAQGARRMM
jgi:hypothetical protein